MTRSPYPPVRLSPRALANHYQGFVRSLADRRPETRGTYTRALREFLVWFPRQARFVFGVADVVRYKRHLSVRRRLASVSVATYLTALRRFFDYLVLQGVLPANPAKEVGGASRPAGHSRGTLTADDVRQILDKSSTGATGADCVTSLSCSSWSAARFRRSSWSGRTWVTSRRRGERPC